MRAFKLLLPVVLLAFCVSVLQADTIHVPFQQPTIQAGIDAAVDGDTVLVADGTYTGGGNRDIDFLGKAIVVMSENGPESCVIDCEGTYEDRHRGFYFHNGEGSSSVVKGFTITNGQLGNGGGIKCYYSSPTIENNTITGNIAITRAGGGIYCHNSSPTITGNTIIKNTSVIYGGGIACVANCSPTITGNTISGNSGGGIDCRHNSSPTITGNTISGNGGSGIYCYDSSPTILANRIIGNTAHDGGGIHCLFHSFAIISGNIIIENTANGFGGGIRCSNSDVTIKKNLISANSSYSVNYGGGGIYLNSSDSLIIDGNTITNNLALTNGGGIYCNDDSPTITGNTISGNIADWSGGGIFCLESSPTITNTILWNDSPDEIYIESGTPVVTYSNIQGGWPGEGNIDADPRFILPDRQDYRLLWDSPCIDTGHPDSLDADSTRSDMGAYYFNQDDYLTLYMTPDETEVAQGGQMGVTYTIINRWQQKEPFTALTRVTLPDGEVRTILGPEDYEICPGYTAQIHLPYPIPPCAYLGMYEYQGAIGVPPSTLYDDDSFKFWVME